MGSGGAAESTDGGGQDVMVRGGGRTKGKRLPVAAGLDGDRGMDKGKAVEAAWKKCIPSSAVHSSLPPFHQFTHFH